MKNTWTNIPGWLKFLILYVVLFLLLWSDVRYSSTNHTWYDGMSARASAVAAFFGAGIILFLIDRNR